ncbi:CHAD domain-containing protein [Kitasatospora sp. NPDC004745]|uniref:CYTH and CHAD domain-containing protein n=1 Tax=Kitasatospora sp. NPDC004745 TaxID=3364019 RepID=UPI0036C1AF79
MGTHQETERKYDGAALPGRLDRVKGVAAARSTDPEELDAVYYDTQDLRLLRRRITLRRRTGGEDAGWHLKLPRGGDVREEFRLPLTAGPPNGVPAELARLVAAFTRRAPVRPVARLRTRRAAQALVDDRGSTLAQVTEDQVTVQLLDAERLPAARLPSAPADGAPAGAADGAGTEARGWTEFEVELVDGAPALLDRVEELLTEAGLARSSSPSKLSRALGEPAPPEARPDGPEQAEGTAGALVMDAFRARLETLLHLDPAVRCGEEDSVHRMRVTARRLRSLLKAHRRLFDRDRADPLTDRLRRLTRLLGQARDQEVLGAELVDGLDAVPAPLRPDALRGRLTERYARGYRTAWQRAVAELDGPRYFALLDDLDAFAADPPLRGRAGRPASAHLSRVLRHEQRRTVRRLDEALRLDPGPRRDELLHRARKAAKRARYAADDVQSQVPHRTAKRAAKFGAAMKKLHKVLGTHQDSVVARQELIALQGEDTAAGRSDAFAYGVLHERWRHTADTAQRRLPELRHRASRRRLTRLP